MPPSHKDLPNELQTRQLSKTIHTLIDAHRTSNSLQPFEWDLSLYYLALSLSKAIFKYENHPNTHAYPQKKCIGVSYNFSAVKTHQRPDVHALFRTLDHRNWQLDGFIFSTVAAYHKPGLTVVVNVVSRGAVIPRRVCPLCEGASHFSASQAAAVFARLVLKTQASVTASASTDTTNPRSSTVTTPSPTISLTPSSTLPSVPDSIPIQAQTSTTAVPQLQFNPLAYPFSPQPQPWSYPNPWWYGNTYPG